MDWLDEILEKIKSRVNNYSIKKALVVYIVICIIIIAVLTVITQNVCGSWDSLIMSKYSPLSTEYSANLRVFYGNYYKLSKLDSILADIVDIIQTWSTIIYSIIGILVVSYLFYNKKLKEPLAILKEATDRVSKNDLNIELYYDNKDEMGDLCRSFDLMRKQLIDNNQKLWDMMEEQRRLNAAFAHDLRTPLTVLRGYSDFLKTYVPKGQVKEEKLISTLSMMSENIDRLEKYSSTMKEIYSMEELAVKVQPVNVIEFERKLREVTDILNGNNGIHIKLLNSIFEQPEKLSFDEAVVMEVFENLMSNALRYAEKEIEVILSLSEDGTKLLLSVADDGNGFTNNDLFMAVKPYYTDDKEHKTQHFGIGLYVCKILCEKHQGYLILENRMKKGAIVTAFFSLQ